MEIRNSNITNIFGTSGFFLNDTNYILLDSGSLSNFKGDNFIFMNNSNAIELNQMHISNIDATLIKEIKYNKILAKNSSFS